MKTINEINEAVKDFNEKALHITNLADTLAKQIDDYIEEQAAGDDEDSYWGDTVACMDAMDLAAELRKVTVHDLKKLED